MHQGHLLFILVSSLSTLCGGFSFSSCDSIGFISKRCVNRFRPSMAQVDPAKALDFFRLVGKLKTTPRTGWVNNEVKSPESIADHMYRMSMLAMLITDPAINKDRLIKICLVHDLGESIVGKIFLVIFLFTFIISNYIISL